MRLVSRKKPRSALRRCVTQGIVWSQQSPQPFYPSPHLPVIVLFISPLNHFARNLLKRRELVCQCAHRLSPSGELFNLLINWRRFCFNGERSGVDTVVLSCAGASVYTSVYNHAITSSARAKDGGSDKKVVLRRFEQAKKL